MSADGPQRAASLPERRRRRCLTARPPAGLDRAAAANSCAAAVTKPAKLEARDTLRLALPSKGRMAEDTLQLLKASRRPACFRFRALYSGRCWMRLGKLHACDS